MSRSKMFSVKYGPVFLAVALAFSGCQDKEFLSGPAGYSPPESGGGFSLTTTTTFETDDGTWTLTAFDPVYNPAGDSTTFSYELTGPDKNMHFVIGYPLTSCTEAPISWRPSSGNLNWSDFPIFPNVSWHPPVGSGGTNTFSFSYSFAGDIPAADVGTGIRVEGVDYYEGYFIQGPGIPTYIVSGNAFQDANANGFRDMNETAIPVTTIDLIQGGTTIASTATDANGYYEFEVSCGSYTVEIDTSTLTGTQSTYFVNTTPLSLDVSVGPDAPGNDFGFDVNTTKVVADLDNGDLPTTGLTANVWKKEYQFAASGKKAFFPRDSLLVFLDRVGTLALDHPFVFEGTDDEQLAAAYDLLRKPTHTSLDVLERELLALELNHAAGLGVDLSTQLVLIGWGETLYIENGGTLNPKFGNLMEGTIDDATEVYMKINRDKSPGGGGTR